MKNILILICALTCFQVFSKPVASIIKIRGSVSQLIPGTKNPRNLNLGDRIVEDTSIVTGPKSYVVLRFDDRSRISLGPKSKMVVVRVRKKETSVVNLLKGKIRSKVIKRKNKNSKHKLIIKTRTAAMGVRGTDFTSIYNPENKMTSLVTLEGEVAMAKMRAPVEKTRKQVREDAEVTLNNDNEVQIEQRVKQVSTSIEKIENVLDSNKSVVVKPGQYSGVATGLERVTEPVKINPVQYNVMYNNNNLVERDSSKVKKINVYKVNTKNLKLKPAPQDAPPEGFFDKVTGKYAPRAGGYVDFETGIYVPPAKSSIFDKNTGVYLSNKVGSIDKLTGQYVPPKGITLDAKEGFVKQKIRVLNRKKEDEIKTRLASLEKELNQNTMTDVLLYDPEEDVEDELYIRLGEKERLNRDIITLSIINVSQELESSDDQLQAGGSESFSSDSSTGFKLSLDHSTNSKWQAITEFGLLQVPFNDAGSKGYTKNSDSLVSLGAGARFYMSPTWFIKGLLTLEQYFFIDHVSESTTTTDQLTKSMVPKLSVTFEGEFFKRKHFSLVSDLGLFTNLPKSAGATDIEPGFGFYADFGAKYQHNNRWLSNLRGWFEGASNEIKGSGFTATNDRQSAGLKYSISYIFN